MTFYIFATHPKILIHIHTLVPIRMSRITYANLFKIYLRYQSDNLDLFDAED